ncbi:MAG: SDR family oxidoreductase [Deltaproteobacteria bacterium]|nr:SDR family oxidoreductase [Deltaproteobacteria bacterium]
MSERRGKTVVVTGGAGFIGSHLTERMVGAGHQVRVLDDFSTGRPENLAHLAAPTNLSLRAVDIVSDPLDEHFAGADVVFHLAARADIVPSIDDPITYHRANVDGTVAVLEAARRAGVARLVYAASSSCYGIPDHYPTAEHAPARPQYPYALTKYLGEQCVLHWHQVYGLSCNVLRLFNVYGPRSRTNGTYGAVFGVFLAQKLANKPFTVVGDGRQTRDFVFVSDVVDAFVNAAEIAADGLVANIGAGNPQSIRYLVELLGGTVVYIPKRPGEPPCTHADISRANEQLGWAPRTSFEQGVAKMLEQIDYWRDAPVWDAASISSATERWFACLEGAKGG